MLDEWSNFEITGRFVNNIIFKYYTNGQAFVCFAIKLLFKTLDKLSGFKKHLEIFLDAK